MVHGNFFVTFHNVQSDYVDVRINLTSYLLILLTIMDVRTLGVPKPEQSSTLECISEVP